MYPPIRCFCGRALGDYIALYESMVAMELKRHPNVTPAKLRALVGQNTPIGHILDALGLRLECCRMHMITFARFYDYY